jgi:transcription elongation factor GreA
LSPDGLLKLKEELSDRQNRLRKEITEKISVAKEQGDLSENFEYSNAKEMQAMNETRIGELEEMIKNAVVIQSQGGGSTVALGTSFMVELADGREKSFTIVGSTESDPLSGKISNESPLGQVFLGKAVGDSVEVPLPGGQNVTYRIISIQ